MRKLTLLLGLLLAQYTNGQTATDTHTVSKGETLYQLAKKYKTTVQAIITLNPETADGLKEEQVIKIPQTEQLTHTVLAKETIYGISKQYNVAINKLYDYNPGLKENGLKEGQTIYLTKNVLSPKNTPSTTAEKTSSTTSKHLHTVEKGETLFAISQKYNIAISYLYEWNPILNTQTLQEGQTIQIAKTNPNNENFVSIDIKPKETLYNIQKTYRVSQDELLKYNPTLSEGLKEGMTIKIPVKNFTPKTNTKEEIKNTTPTLNPNKILGGKHNQKRELILLMPFDLEENNPNSSNIQKKLNEDVFLNIAIDFYAGAELALEDIKSKNYPLNIKIIDSKEKHNSLNIKHLESIIDFSSTDVIIGPFFQKNVDDLSKKLENSPTVIVSPISTEKGKPYKNQIHTMPNEDLMKSETIHFLQSKNGNIVSIYLPSQTNKINELYADFKDIKKISTNAKGNVTTAMIEPLLTKDEKNFVILDAHNHLATVETILSLKKLQNKYNIQLVSLQKNNYLESSDINIKDLADLEMIFPSVTNEENSWKRNNFYSKFSSKYGKKPSKYAVRGYDVVYDVINRMFSGTEHEDLFDYGTTQIENKFVYIKNNNGVYNNGLYIMQYTKDLKIKEAK